MMTFRQYLTEMKNGKYAFSSTQINFPQSLSNEIMDWGEDNIKEDDVFVNPDDPAFGREDEIHLTILYGIHTEDSDEVKKLISGQKPFKVSLGPLSIFTTNDDFDVVKVESTGTHIYRLHNLLEKNLEVTQNYPVYKPHVTIAYVKKGKCKDLVDNKDFAGKEFEAKEMLFSSKNGNKTKIEFS